MSVITRQCEPPRTVDTVRHEPNLSVVRSDNGVTVIRNPAALVDLGGCPPRAPDPKPCNPGVVEVISKGPKGDKGDPGTDVGSHPTISAESAELFTLLRGMPVALVAGKLRRATALPPFNAVVGLVHDESILAGTFGRVQTDGPLEQPATEWELITGMPGGIAPNAVHFLSPTGELTPFAPANEGQVVAPVGRATTPTTFVIDIDTQVHL